jgi:hypothetical protein
MISLKPGVLSAEMTAFQRVKMVVPTPEMEAERAKKWGFD